MNADSFFTYTTGRPTVSYKYWEGYTVLAMLGAVALMAATPSLRFAVIAGINVPPGQVCDNLAEAGFRLAAYGKGVMAGGSGAGLLRGKRHAWLA